MEYSIYEVQMDNGTKYIANIPKDANYPAYYLNSHFDEVYKVTNSRFIVRAHEKGIKMHTDQMTPEEARASLKMYILLI